MKISTIFLQAVVVLIGIAALSLMLWEPHIEGRNAHATLFQIYFNDPFLAYAYTASLSFFAALYQSFKVLGYARQDTLSSPASIKAMRTIKLCALAMIGFVAGGEIIILLGKSDDRAGGVFMGILIAFGAIVVAAAATMLNGFCKMPSHEIPRRNRGPWRPLAPLAFPRAGGRQPKAVE
jgi:hypothetical protein